MSISRRHDPRDVVTMPIPATAAAIVPSLPSILRTAFNSNRRSRAALSEDQFVPTLNGPKMIAWPDRAAGVRGELAQRAALQHFAFAN